MMRRVVSGTAVGMAVLGASLVAGGTATANEGHHQKQDERPTEVSQGKGSLVYAPIETNVCGNSITTLGQLNPAFGNTCVNQSGIGDESAVQSSPTGPENPETIPPLPSP